MRNLLELKKLLLGKQKFNAIGNSCFYDATKRVLPIEYSSNINENECSKENTTGYSRIIRPNKFCKK